MAHTWLSVTVELLGGRGEELWPRPGRIFAVGPSHTFADLATARDVVQAEDLADQWHAFATDRQLGRAREFLADRGIRVG